MRAEFYKTLLKHPHMKQFYFFNDCLKAVENAYATHQFDSKIKKTEQKAPPEHKKIEMNRDEERNWVYSLCDPSTRIEKHFFVLANANAFFQPTIDDVEKEEKFQPPVKACNQPGKMEQPSSESQPLPK